MLPKILVELVLSDGKHCKQTTAVICHQMYNYRIISLEKTFKI